MIPYHRGASVLLAVMAQGLMHCLADAPIEIRPPVPLQPARCDLPAQLRQISGHALFRYLVDETGKVEQVESLYVSASTDSDRPAFVGALEGCVKSWRYQPRTIGGKPVAEKVLMAFHYLPAAADDAPLVTFAPGQSMPLSHFVEIRQEKLKLAAALLGGQDYAEVPGDGWLLRTDVPRAEAERIAGTIRAAGAAFDAAFPGVPALPGGSKATILLFQRDDEFNQVAAFDNLIRMHFAIAGQYNPQEQIIYTSVGDKPTSVAASVLAHEVTHHFVCQRLFQGSRKPPLWVNEGIATFIESLKPAKKGKVDLEAIDRAAKVKGQTSWLPHSVSFLDTLTAESRANGLSTLAEYLDPKPGQQVNLELMYGMSWLMVHYLLNAHEGAYRARFKTWLLDPGALEGPAGLTSMLGMPHDEMLKELRQHLWRMTLPR